MKNLPIALIAATMMCLAACDKSSKTVSADSMELYVSDGFVQKPDPRSYRITKQGVMEDTVVWMNTDKVFDYPVPAERSEIAKALLDKIPAKMWKDGDKTYSTNMADVGYYTLMVTRGDKTYKWSISADVLNLPDYVRVFAADVQAAAAELKR